MATTTSKAPTVTSVQTSPNGQNKITTYSNGTSSFSGPTSSGGQGVGIQVATNPTTGALLSNPHDNSGYNPTTDPTSSAYNSITSKAMLGSTPIPVVSPTQTQDYSSILTKSQNQVTPVTAEQQVQNKQTDLFNSYFQNQKAPADLMKIQNNLESQNQLRQKQESVNTYQTQLNNITAKAQADVLSVTGQGRGIPEAIIGGQQAQINKEAAIQSLPVQAQLASAQGDLQMAQIHVDKLFSIYAQDAQNQVDYYNKQATMVYGFLDKQQQQQLDTIRADKTFAQNTLLKTMDAQQGYAEVALKNGSLAAFNAITGVRPPTDLNSPTYSQDYATYQQNLNRAVSKYGVGGGGAEVTNGVPDKIISKIQQSSEYKTITGVMPAIQTIKDYMASVNDSGTYEFASGTKAGTKKATYGNAIAAWKTLAGLGALSGADFGLAENVIPEPAFFARKSTFIAQLNSALDNAVKQTENLTTRLNQNYPIAAPLLNAQLDDVKVIAYPDKYVKGPDGLVYEVTK
jgi:hypothetical protein